MHDADACGRCTFVANVGSIVVSPSQKEAATVTLCGMLKGLAGLRNPEEGIIEVGTFSLPQWSGHAMFYLFECPECGQLSVDYLHGNRPYLVCDHCDCRLSVSQQRFYEEAGLTRPPTGWQVFVELRRLRRGYRKSPSQLPPASEP